MPRACICMLPQGEELRAWNGILSKKLPTNLLCAAGGRIKNRIKRLGSAVKNNSRKYRKSDNAPYEVDISGLSPWERLQGNFPAAHILRVDQAEWALVEQFNFGGPLGQTSDSEDGTQPEEFCIGGGDANFWSRHVEPEDIFTDITEHEAPPGYGWAAISTLPLPVNIERSDQEEPTPERECQVWASVYAGRREKAKLLAAQKYISTRIAEIDEQTKAVLRPRVKADSWLELKYNSTHAQMLMADAGIHEPDPIEHCRVAEHEPFHPWFFRPGQDILKGCIIRDRLSPASIFRSGCAVRR